MRSLYRLLLLLVSLPRTLPSQKNGVDRSWPFAMRLKDLSRTG